MHTKPITILTVLLVGSQCLSAASAEARYRGEVAAWVPWWSTDAQLTTLEQRIDELDILYPFVYEIDEAGEIIEQADLTSEPWQAILDEAEDERVDVIPTIAWFNGAAIHETLRDRRARRDLVQAIEKLVDDNDFDGINIDFEQKKAATIDHFSDFLEELEDELGRDELTCTVEARMRPKHRWRAEQIPDEVEYANDYRAMNRYCDWVEIMAYDQQRADIILNEQRRGVPYSPVADRDWVEHVLEFALEDFDEATVMLGIPTYGRAWDLTVAADWYRDYTSVASLNHQRIIELSEKYEAPIGRSAGGEAVISFFPEGSKWELLNQLPVPEDTPRGYEAAAKALLFATMTDLEVPVRFISWSDAAAIDDKLELAETFNLRGVALFSISGSEDANLWRLF